MTARSLKKDQRYVYYLIGSDEGRTYSGISTDFKHRIRQHNRELKGGALYTSFGTNWKPLLLLRGLGTEHNCKRFECFTKPRWARSYTGKKFCKTFRAWLKRGPKKLTTLHRRVLFILFLLKMDEWQQMKDQLEIQIHNLVLDQDMYFTREFSSFITHERTWTWIKPSFIKKGGEQTIAVPVPSSASNTLTTLSTSNTEPIVHKKKDKEELNLDFLLETNSALKQLL